MLGDDSCQFGDLHISSVLFPFSATWAKMPCTLVVSCSLLSLFTPIRPATTCWPLPGSFLPASTCLTGRPCTTLYTLSAKGYGYCPQCQCQFTQDAVPALLNQIKLWERCKELSSLYKPHLCTGRRAKVKDLPWLLEILVRDPVIES